ncbi:MAG TPA: DUF4279 domain-containing protein [Paraburkholderia sp.]|jgi:hypothetical protein|nr:DUF4279 domain-containing protein [Paraburkholderia sp.]
MKSHQLAHASFTISGHQVVPEFWTDYFGVVPDIAIKEGDAINDPTGQGRILTRRTGVWGMRSQTAVRSDSLTPHLRYLLDQLRLPRDDLRRLIKAIDGQMRFFCYWDNRTGDRVPDVPEDIRAMMEFLGGVIEIDEYR